MKKIKKLKKFIVNVREVHVQPTEVLAYDADDAIQKVAEGEGDTDGYCLEYSHTLDRECWTTAKIWGRGVR